MACVTPSHCQPCTTCGQPVTVEAAPTCPVLPDGTYTNATIVVEDGCISVVADGAAPLYSPEVCCAPVGGVGGGTGLDGDQGPPGTAATVSVGTVSSLPYGSAPIVTNTGSPTNAIFNFSIPRGEPGDDGDSVTGATSTEAAIQLDNGLIKDPLPITWPPVLSISFQPSAVVGVVLSTTKDDSDGSVVLQVDLSSFATTITNDLADHENRVTTLETSFSKPESFTVAMLPSASGAGAGQMVYVSNEVGGAIIAFSDGTDWRRVTDRAIVA